MSNTDASKHAVYAILADSVYWDVREYNAKIGDKHSPNWTPIPDGWIIIHEVSKSGGGISWDSLTSGFTARAYQNTATNEVVIAYAGTLPADIGDLGADIKLPLGLAHTQASEAAIFYHDVKHMVEKSSTPNTTIKFTGHSLGGGLAGLMGILFDKEAIIFDHAPFKSSASLDNPYINGREDLNGLDDYITTIDAIMIALKD